MAKKVNTDFSTSSWSFIHDEIERIQQKVGADLNKGLEDATDYLADKLQAATPVETGITKESWVKTVKYKNVKYINNVAINKRGMPIVNILEYSKSKGKPFVRRIVEENKGKLEQIIRASVEESKDNG
jgi:hypothetical protein